MKWIDLKEISQLERICTEKQKCVIFKHSVKCQISQMVKKEFERDWVNLSLNLPSYYLDLINYRDISNKIAERFHVQHESPQVLLIKDGKCTYTASHEDVKAEQIKKHSLLQEA